MTTAPGRSRPKPNHVIRQGDLSRDYCRVKRTQCTAPMRKDRPFADGFANESSRPLAALQDRAYERAGSARKRSSADGFGCAISGRSDSDVGKAACACRRAPRDDGEGAGTEGSAVSDRNDYPERPARKRSRRSKSSNWVSPGFRVPSRAAMFRSDQLGSRALLPHQRTRP